MSGAACLAEGYSRRARPGARAWELWQEAIDRGLDDPVAIWMSCYLLATHQTLAEVMASLPPENPSPTASDSTSSTAKGTWKEPDE